MSSLQPQPSINDARTKALMALIARLGNLDLTPLLVYKLDTVADDVLPSLAWQFDVTSNLWQLVAAGEEEISAITDIASLISISDLATEPGAPGTVTPDLPQRIVLQQAIPLHRTRGTPSAILAALDALGWSDASLLEGQSSWGGSSYPANQGWAVCRIEIALGAGEIVNPGDAATIIAAFDFFKPARVLLDGLWFETVALADDAPPPTDRLVFAGDFVCVDSAGAPADFVSGEGWQPSDNYPSPTILYNGAYLHAGYYHGGAQPLVIDSGIRWNGQFVRGVM